MMVRYEEDIVPSGSIFLNNGVRANGIQNLAQKPVMNCLNKALRFASGVGIACSSKFQDIANRKQDILEACSIINLALGGHHLGHTSWHIRNVLMVNKPYLKKT